MIRKKSNFILATLFLVLVLPIFGFAREQPSVSREETLKSASQGLHKSNTIELKALEIRAKIYEPQVIYVLDRSRIDLELKEEPVRFIPRVEVPLTQNTLE